MKSISFIAVFCICVSSFSQPLKQVVRGTVVDHVSRQSLPGATIIVVGTDPLVGGTSDENGNFKLTGVPLGQHTLRISFVGYKERTYSLVVNSGKEVVLKRPDRRGHCQYGRGGYHS
jgi:hypothetical protein